MKWKKLIPEVPPLGDLKPDMTFNSGSHSYRGLLCIAYAIHNKETERWEAQLTIAYPMYEKVRDEEIQTDLFWKDFADAFDTDEQAIAASLALGKEIVDGKHAGLNEFL